MLDENNLLEKKSTFSSINHEKDKNRCNINEKAATTGSLVTMVTTHPCLSLPGSTPNKTERNTD